MVEGGLLAVFFIFIFFFIFYKNIFSIWKFTEIYPGRPAAGRLGLGRPAAGRQGLKHKKEEKKLQTGPWGRSPGSGAADPPGRPIAGRPAPQAARQQGDQLPQVI